MRVKTNIPLEPVLKAEVKEYCKENGILFYKVIELALKDYLKRHEVKS